MHPDKYTNLNVIHSISFQTRLKRTKCRWSDNIYRQRIPNRNWVGKKVVLPWLHTVCNIQICSNAMVLVDTVGPVLIARI